jgi:ribosome maturation factor RimP
MHGGSRQGSRRPAPESAQGGRGPAGQGPDLQRLERLLEPVIKAMDMDLEGIRVTTAGRRRLLRVVVDADGGVSLDDISHASRELSLKLDSVAEMGEFPYTLEVSSPGIDRPLTQPRHWRRAIGRLVVAPLHAGDRSGHEGNGDALAEGRIVGSSDTAVTLECDGLSREFRYSELGPGRVQVEFGHFDADDALPEED